MEDYSHLVCRGRMEPDEPNRSTVVTCRSNVDLHFPADRDDTFSLHLKVNIDDKFIGIKGMHFDADFIKKTSIYHIHYRTLKSL